MEARTPQRSSGERIDALTPEAGVLTRLATGAIAVFLDFDGTLATVTPDPADTTLDPSMRDTVRELASHCFVSVVTGRALHDVRTKVGLPSLAYAGCHGFEIAGPGFDFVREPSLRRAFDALATELSRVAAEFDGTLVEAKGYSISVHHARMPPARIPELEAAIASRMERFTGIRRAVGRNIIELRPAIDWHKGSAVNWMLERRPAADGAVVPVYIGDDRTDEDALGVVADSGIGIVVGEPAWPSAARFGLRDIGAVEEFLHRLLDARS